MDVESGVDTTYRKEEDYTFNEQGFSFQFAC